MRNQLMQYDTLRYEVGDGIATITLDRPDRLNAFNVQMQNELIAVFDRVDVDDQVRAVIVTGAGRAFCAGADLEAGADAFNFESLPDSPVRADGSLDYSRESARDGGGLVSLRIFRCVKPVIAAINGPAVGVGATMTLPMDVRLIADGAKMGFVFSKRGIVPEACSSYFLPRLVGISQALQWCYSGRVFSADEAHSGGLVQAVVSPEELLTNARELARQFMDETSPVSVSLIRQMLWRGLGYDHPMEAHKVESRGILARGRSEDVAEGVTAFLEKRPVSFPGRVSADMPDYYPWWEEPAYG